MLGLSEVKRLEERFSQLVTKERVDNYLSRTESEELYFLADLLGGFYEKLSLKLSEYGKKYYPGCLDKIN